MKNINKTALIGTLMFPFCAFAHGEEVILTLFSQVIVLILVLIVIGITNWKVKGKLLLILLYILSIFLTELLVFRIPYFQNEILITILLLVLPIFVICLSYFMLKQKFEKIAKK